MFLLQRAVRLTSIKTAGVQVVQVVQSARGPVGVNWMAQGSQAHRIRVYLEANVMTRPSLIPG